MDPPNHPLAEGPMDGQYVPSQSGWNNVQNQDMSGGSTSRNQFQRPPQHQHLYHPQPSSSPQTMGNMYPYQQPPPVGYQQFGYQEPSYPVQTMGMGIGIPHNPGYLPNHFLAAPSGWSGPNGGYRNSLMTDMLPPPPEYRQQRSGSFYQHHEQVLPPRELILPSYHSETRATQNEYQQYLEMPRQPAKRKGGEDIALPPSKIPAQGQASGAKPRAQEQETTTPQLEFPFSYLPTFSSKDTASQASGSQLQDTQAQHAQAYEPIPRTYDAFWSKTATYSSPTPSLPSSDPSPQLESQQLQSQQGQGQKTQGQKAQGRKGQSQIPPFQPPELPQPQHRPQQVQGQKRRGRKSQSQGQGQGQKAQSPRLPTPQLSQSPQLPPQQTEGQFQYYQLLNQSPRQSQSPQLRPQQTQGQFQYQPPQGQGQSPQPPKPKRGRPPIVRSPKPAPDVAQAPITAAAHQPAYAPAYSSVYAPPVLHPHDSACCPNGVQSEFCRQGMMFRARPLTPVPQPFPELHEISDTQRFVPDGEGGWFDLAELGHNWEWKAYTDKEDLKLMLALKRAGLDGML
ncbi:hypothetical protein BDZ45DRAFT_724382 [Acephala macrosclerotiorum]|nr:hypothetical protein BDZ45DRAFT_724382 [Acephala macrosclerotiorum]